MKVNIRKFNQGVTERKIEVQIDRWDTYSLEHTTALIVLPMLLQLRNTKMGVPSEFGDVGGADYDSQYSFDFYTESYNDAFNEGCKRWDDILDKMIWSFQQLVDDNYDSQYHHGEMDIEWKKTEKQYMNPISGKMEYMSEMVDKNPNDHWYDFVGHMLHEERIQEGFELFGKYFRNLWD